MRRFLLTVLSLLGASLSGLTIFLHEKRQLLPDQNSFCNIDQHFNCDAVIASSYSNFLGISLGGWGIAFYVALVFLTLWRSKERASAELRDALLLALALAALSLSLVLFGVSELIIGALCPVCLAIYLVNFIIFALVYWQNYRSPFGARILLPIKVLLNLSNSTSQVGAPAFETRLALKSAGLLLGLGLLFACGLVALLPAVFRASILAQLKNTTSGVANEIDPLADWQKRNVQNIPVKLTDGLDVDYSKGRVDAPIQVVEFADYECPACRRLFFQINSLLEQYTDKVHMVFKNYPLDSSCNNSIQGDMHLNACVAAVFARCAGEQGKFWQANEYLFTLPEFDDHDSSAEQVRDAILQGMQVLSLDSQGMQECINSKRQLAKIEHDIALGNRIGLRSTPSIWVNGKQLERASEANLRRTFELLLGKP